MAQKKNKREWIIFVWCFGKIFIVFLSVKMFRFVVYVHISLHTFYCQSADTWPELRHVKRYTWVVAPTFNTGKIEGVTERILIGLVWPQELIYTFYGWGEMMSEAIQKLKQIYIDE